MKLLQQAFQFNQSLFFKCTPQKNDENFEFSDSLQLG